MMINTSSLTSLYPVSLWTHFYQLTQIPRPSKHEQQVVDYCVNFANARGLAVHTDAIGNVIIRKPATTGFENCKTVVLQSHLDMVPQKNAATEHNFVTDPINAVVDGNWVTALGTTLGADNGIGVATILAILESRELAHGPIEALLTVDEEAGMNGAMALSASALQGELLLNLDTEEEGELYVGCAGGIDVNGQFAVQWQAVPANDAGARLSVTGLKGGHSGIDIHLGRGNANKILARLLYVLDQYALEHKVSFGLSAINGGSLRNAIPREALAELTLEAGQFSAVAALLATHVADIKHEYAAVEPNLCITFVPSACAQQVLPAGLTRNIIRAIYACPNGVIRMSDSLPGVVETSSNLARVFIENNRVQLQCLIRSSLETAKMDAVNAISSTLLLAGADAWAENSYPGWAPSLNSELLQILQQVYQKRFGTLPDVKVIHAGLECGLLGQKYPHWDMVSMGPTIRGAHSPDEKVDITSVGKYWDYLIEVLTALPRK